MIGDRSDPEGQSDRDTGLRDGVQQGLPGLGDAVGGLEGYALEAVNAGGKRGFDRGDSVDARGDRQTVAACLGDSGVQLRGGELRQVGQGAEGEVTTAGRDLDDVDVPLGMLADRHTHAVQAGRLAAQVMTVTTDAGDRRAGRDDGRQGGIVPVSQL